MTTEAINIVRNVCYMTGTKPPTTIGDTRNNDANVFRALLNRGGRVLASKRGTFLETWPNLVREYIFTTQSGVDNYALPQDFAGIVDDTAWDRSEYRMAPGNLSPQQWQRLRSGVVDSTALSPRYRLRFDPTTNQTRFYVDPIPGGAEEIVFEYMSQNWVRESAAGAISKSQIEADQDVPVFPQNLMEMDLEWRWLKAKGQSYQTSIAEFEMERNRLFAQSLGSRSVQLMASDSYYYDETSIPSG